MTIEMMVGIAGMGLILIAFIMNQLNKWKSSSLIYDFVNFLGALMLSVYAYFIQSYPFLLLNVVWALFSLKDVYFDVKKKNR